MDSDIEQRYIKATMASDTATIRVTRRTRDQLARQARARGVSLASMLGEIAREREAESIWEQERQARQADAGNPAVADEARLWETTLSDGID